MNPETASYAQRPLQQRPATRSSKQIIVSPRLAEQRRRRAQAIAPLFAYAEQHAILIGRLARRVAMQRQTTFTRNHLSRIKYGQRPAPSWFVAGVCREIGQPIEVVMGAEWAQTHLPQPEIELPTVHPHQQPVQQPTRKAS